MKENILCPLCDKNIISCICTTEDFFGPNDEIMK